MPNLGIILPAALSNLSLTGTFSFAEPGFLWLLLILVLWGVLRRRRKAPSITFPRTPILLNGPHTGSNIPRWLSWFRIAAMVLLILALARPRIAGSIENLTTDGISIILAVDLSSSMLAEDFQPLNRLAVAKSTMKGFVQGRKNDRIGIVAFAGEALTQVPLTTDYPVLIQAIDNLHAGQLEDGTAIGTGIATAANRLRVADGKSKVIILLTDGVNNRGNIDPRTAAQAAYAFGIKLYAIGVGTEGFAPVPVSKGPNGYRYENQKVEIQENLLTEISEMTGGRYFRAHDAAALSRIYSQIDLLERSPVQSSVNVRYTELFRIPLVFAVLLLAAELSLLAYRSPLP